MFFFKVSVISFVFLNADFGKNILKILARTVFIQNENFCMERVKPCEKYISHTLVYWSETRISHRPCIESFECVQVA